MGRETDAHGSVAGVAGTGGYARVLPETDGQYLPEQFDTLPIIEISDKDYRSFCWPCHALEDIGDCQSGP